MARTSTGVMYCATGKRVSEEKVWSHCSDVGVACLCMMRFRCTTMMHAYACLYHPEIMAHNDSATTCTHTYVLASRSPGAHKDVNSNTRLTWRRSTAGGMFSIAGLYLVHFLGFMPRFFSIMPAHAPTLTTSHPPARTAEFGLEQKLLRLGWGVRVLGRQVWIWQLLTEACDGSASDIGEESLHLLVGMATKACSVRPGLLGLGRQTTRQRTVTVTVTCFFFWVMDWAFF